jgi:hypothetical protein
MKNPLLSLVFIITILSTNKLAAQTGMAINTDGTSADGSAMLDVKATDKGILIPRIASTTSVITPVNGLLVYQTGGTAGFYYYNGSAWNYIQNSGNTALDASNLTSGTVPVARLGSSGTASSSTFLRGDNTWAAAGGSSSGFQYALLTSGMANTVTVTDVSIRTIIGDLNGTSGNASGTAVNLTLPGAASYGVGTTITFEMTGYTGGALATLNFTSAGSTISSFNFSNSSTTGSAAFSSVSRFQVATDGVSHWYRVN